MSKRSSTSLGRRLLPALVMTTAASGLVALLDRPSSGAAVDLGGETGATLPAQADGGTTVEPPVVSSTAPATGQNSPSSVPVTKTPAATTAPAVASGAACEGQTIDGPTVDTRWGPVQVEAIVSTSGQICDVDAIQSPSDHRRSVQINQIALPILHQEVMTAQSAAIDGVSGATITSRGYQRSLQSILDSVGS